MLEEIKSMVRRSQIQDYRPLLFVIPFHFIEARVKDVPVAKRANPWSSEYTIESLPTDYFDVLELM